MDSYCRYQVHTRTVRSTWYSQQRTEERSLFRRDGKAHKRTPVGALRGNKRSSGGAQSQEQTKGARHDHHSKTERR